MNRLTGYIEKEINGEMRRFKFGTNSSAILCELEGCSLTALADKIKTSATIMQNMLLAGHLAYCRSHRIETDVDLWQVGDWMDELKHRGELEDIYEAMKKANEGPNEPAQTKRAERRETEKKTVAA